MSKAYNEFYMNTVTMRSCFRITWPVDQYFLPIWLWHITCLILLFTSVFSGKPRGLGNSDSETKQSCKIPRLLASGTSKPCEIVLGRYHSCGSRFVQYTMTQTQLSSNRWRLLKMEPSKSLVFWEQWRTAHSTYTGAELHAVWWVPVGLALRRSIFQI